jgi:hypothetical protein
MKTKKHLKILVKKDTGNTDTENPNVVSFEELVAIIKAKTGKSDAMIREVLRLYGEILFKELDENNELQVEGSSGIDLLFKRLNVH